MYVMDRVYMMGYTIEQKEQNKANRLNSWEVKKRSFNDFLCKHLYEILKDDCNSSS